MCDPFQTIADIGLSLIPGGAAFIPLLNTGIGLAEGKGLGRSLLGGVESLAGQELAGAFGFGSGNDIFNNALGITGDNPAGTGLPDIGGGIERGFSGFQNTDAAAADANNLIDTPVSDSINPQGSGTAGFSSTPSTGGITGASQAGDLGNQGIWNAASQSIGANTDVPGVGTQNFTSLGDITSPGSGADFSTALNTPVADSIAGGALPGSVGTDIASSAPKDFFSRAGDFIGNHPFQVAEGVAGVGSLAYQAIQGPPKLPDSALALGQGGAVTGPLIAAESSQLGEFNSGQLSTGEEANIQQYVQEQQNMLIQQLASQGVTDMRSDSRYIQGLSTIQQRALQLQQQYLTAALNNGLSAAGAAGRNLGAVADAQLKADSEFQTAMNNAFAAIGGIFGQRSAHA